MKITLQQIAKGKDEVIIKYRKMVYKIKRDIDTEMLNQELEHFKKRKG